MNPNNNTNHTSIQHLVDYHEQEKKKKQQVDAAAFSKESGPPGRVMEAPVMPEIIEQNNEKKEVAAFVEEVDEQKIKLSADLKKAGLSSTQENQLPPSFQNIQLPMTDEKILNGHKAPISSSVRWLAEFCLFLLKKAHLGLKVVHGHVVRVIQR